MTDSLFGGSSPGNVRKLPCGCWGMLRVEGDVVIDADAFLCEQRHKQGQRLTLADVASLAVARALGSEADLA